MTTAATNYLISPKDGWVNVAPTASKFVRISAFPHTHPYYVSFGSSAPALLGTNGTGTVTFSTGVPTAGNTVTVGTEVYTFRAAASLPFEVTIGSDFHVSATNFTAIVNAQSKLVTASDASDVVTLLAKAVGTQGNLGLSKVGANIAVSGAVLTGGTDAQPGILVCHKPYWMNITTDAKMWARVVNPVPNSNNVNGSLRLDVVTIV